MTKYKTAIPSEAAVKTAEVVVAFQRMIVDHDFMEPAFEQLDAMRIAHAEGGPGPRRIGLLMAPAQCGKSSMLNAYIHHRIIPELIAEDPALADIDPFVLAVSQRRVVHVTLGEDASVKSLASDILVALKDPDPYTGTRPTLWKRVHNTLETLNAQLLVIDEIQHLASSTTLITSDSALQFRSSASDKVRDALKVLATRGTIPIVLAGISQAKSHLKPSTQVMGRVLFELELSVIDWADAKDRRTFTEFLGRLALEMEDVGLVTSAPPLIFDDIPSRLYLASQGRLGMVCRILETATILAVRQGRTEIDTSDLMAAVDAVCVSRGFIEANPFRTERIARLEMDRG